MKKVYVVGEAKNYANFINDCKLTNKLEEADIVVFTGGEDVDPSLYGCKKHVETYSNIERDLEEKAVFEKIKPNQLVVGICRGSQFLCVMNGGILVQHVTGHGIWHTHPIYCKDGSIYEITSTHHQMQYPFRLKSTDFTMIATSYNALSGTYEGDQISSQTIDRCGEPEIVLYHKANMPKCIAIQGHPEYMRKESPVVTYLNALINNYLNLV